VATKKPPASGLPALLRAEPAPGTCRYHDKAHERNMNRAGGGLFPVSRGVPSTGDRPPSSTSAFPRLTGRPPCAGAEDPCGGCGGLSADLKHPARSPQTALSCPPATGQTRAHSTLPGPLLEATAGASCYEAPVAMALALIVRRAWQGGVPRATVVLTCLASRSGALRPRRQTQRDGLALLPLLDTRGAGRKISN